MIPRPGTRRPPRRHLRLATHGRSPPRTSVGARVVPPVDGPANASPDDQHDQLLDASLLPSQPLTAKVLRPPVESALASLIAVMDQPRVGSAIPDGHVEGVHHQLGSEVVGHRPANHPAAEDIQDHGQVQPARPGRDVGDVRGPHPIRCRRREPPPDQVWGRSGLRVPSSQPSTPAPVTPNQPGGPHQPSDPFAAHLHTVVQPELGVDAWGAVGGPAAGMDGPDLLGELLVGDRSGRGWPALPGVEARVRHTQHAAQLGDSVVRLLLLDQPEPHRR